MLNSGPLEEVVNAPKIARATRTVPWGATGAGQSPCPLTQFSRTLGGRFVTSIIDPSKSTLTASRTPGTLSYSTEMSNPFIGWKSLTTTLIVTVEPTLPLLGLGSTVRIFDWAYAGGGKKTNGIVINSSDKHTFRVRLKSRFPRRKTDLYSMFLSNILRRRSTSNTDDHLVLDEEVGGFMDAQTL